MIAIQNLSLVAPHRVTPGTLMLHRAGYPKTPLLATSVDEHGDMVPSVLELCETGKPRFRVRAAATNEGDWLAIDRWELRVDPGSSYAATSGDAQPGDAFIWEGVPGLVGTLGFGLYFVPTVGAAFGEKAWTGFVGFKGWQIVHWPDTDSDAVVMYERKPA